MVAGLRGWIYRSAWRLDLRGVSADRSWHIAAVLPRRPPLSVHRQCRQHSSRYLPLDLHSRLRGCGDRLCRDRLRKPTPAPAWFRWLALHRALRRDWTWSGGEPACSRIIGAAHAQARSWSSAVRSSSPQRSPARISAPATALSSVARPPICSPSALPSRCSPSADAAGCCISQRFRRVRLPELCASAAGDTSSAMCSSPASSWHSSCAPCTGSSSSVSRRSSPTKARFTGGLSMPAGGGRSAPRRS